MRRAFSSRASSLPQGCAASGCSHPAGPRVQLPSRATLRRPLPTCAQAFGVGRVAVSLFAPTRNAAHRALPPSSAIPLLRAQGLFFGDKAFKLAIDERLAFGEAALASRSCVCRVLNERRFLLHLGYFLVALDAGFAGQRLASRAASRMDCSLMARAARTLRSFHRTSQYPMIVPTMSDEPARNNELSRILMLRTQRVGVTMLLHEYRAARTVFQRPPANQKPPHISNREPRIASGQNSLCPGLDGDH